MTGTEFIKNMNGLDEDLIQEASGPVRKKRVTRVGWAAIAACLVVVFSVTAYATDLFGISFNVVPDRGYMTVTDGNGNVEELKTWSVEAWMPPVNPKYIKGDVNKLAKVIRDQILANNKGEFVADPPNTIQHLPESYFVHGLSADEAVKYVGYKYLEAPWFPYEKSNTYIEVTGRASDDGSGYGLQEISIHINNLDPADDTKYILPDGYSGFLLIDSEVFMVISDNDLLGMYGAEWCEKEEHYVITSQNGYECHIIDSGEMDYSYPYKSIFGITIKNDLEYRIRVTFSENNRIEAERIVREWAEHF